MLACTGLPRAYLLTLIVVAGLLVSTSGVRAQGTDVESVILAFHAWLENDKAVNIHVDVLDLRVTGDRAHWRARITVDVMPDPFELAAQAVVQNGKITSFMAVPDTQSAQAVMPSTGQAPHSAFAWLVALASLGLLGCGVILRRAH